MRLLVTNDDGIDSPFLHALVHALVAVGHDVCVGAPKTEQSWIGAAKSRARAVEAKTRDCGFKCPTWVIDGTPSDCVNIALDHLVPEGWEPDGVISGINFGGNASIGFIIASGTVSGALEGAIHGLPSVAVSLDMNSAVFEEIRKAGGKPAGSMLESLNCAAAHAARYAPQLIAQTKPRKFIVHNLNYPTPCSASSTVRDTVPAQVIIPKLFSPSEDGSGHRMVFHFGEDLSPVSPCTDRAALDAGQISHSLLDYTQLGHLPGAVAKVWKKD